MTHIRHAPFRHRFRYRFWMLDAELDRLDDLAAASRLLRHNRFGLAAIADRDHGYRDGRPLADYVRDGLVQAGLSRFGARIRFLSMPRVLGYGFNPISFYFCYDEAGVLGAVLHQVKNTFGDQVAYVMPVAGQGPIRQAAAKSMHVSPFFDLAGGYRFAFAEPGEYFTLSISYGGDTPRLTAVMRLRRQPFSDAGLAWLLAWMPFSALQVMGAIHFQALKLFLRGARFHREPERTHPPFINGTAE